METKIKKADILFICILIIITVISLLPIISTENTAENSEVTIYINGELTNTLPLNTNTKLYLNDIGTVVIEDGYVHIENATCSDKLCELFGKISKSYQSIICLPNKTIIKISASDEDFDDISG